MLQLMSHANIKMKYKNLALFWVSLSIILLSNSSLSQRVQAKRPLLNLGLEATSYDNIFSRERNKDTDTSTRANLEAQVEKKEYYYSAELSYNGYETSYLQSSFDNDSGLSGNAQIILGTSSSPIKWLVLNSEQQTDLQSASRNTPDNTRQRSTFSTGPSIKLRLSSTDDISLSHLITSTRTERSNADTEARSSSLSWAHRVSNQTQFNLSTDHTETEPKNQPDTQFSRQAFSFSYLQRLTNGSISTKLEHATVSDFEDFDDFDDTNYTLELSHKLGNGTLNVSAVRTLSDSSVGEPELFSNRDFGSAELDIQLRKRFSLSYEDDQSVALTRLNINISNHESKGKTRNTTEDTQSFFINIIRDLAAQFSLRLKYQYSDSTSTFNSAILEQTEKNIELEVRKRLNKKLETGCSILSTQSDGSFAYKSNEYSCSFSYRLL